MKAKRHILICREGWYYLAVLVFVLTGAIIREINLLMMVAGMMFGPLALNIVAARRSLKRLSVTRVFPEAVSAGETLDVSLKLKNKSPAASWAIVVQDSVRSKQTRKRAAATANVLCSHVPADGLRTVRYQVCFQQRGEYQFRAMKVSSRFPLGLVKVWFRLKSPAELIVYPPAGVLTPNWHRLVRSNLFGYQKSQSRLGNTSNEFFGLRDWRTGDSRREIHWRSSARRGELIVRQFEKQHSEDLLLLLDLWIAENPTPEQREDIETVLSFAATVVRDICRRGGSRLDIGIAGQEIRFLRGDASVGFMSEVLRQLALAQPSSKDQMAELIERAEQQAPRSGQTILLSTRSDSDREQTQDATDSGWQTGSMAATGISAATRKPRAIPIHVASLNTYFEPSTGQ